MPIDTRLVVEQYEKANRVSVLVENYRPNLTVPSLTGKFYAHHEKVDLKTAKQHWIDEINFVKALIPKKRYQYPLTTSHNYGWNITPLIDMNRSDRRFYHPTVQSSMTHIESLIKTDHTMKRPRFTGIPFKLL